MGTCMGANTHLEIHFFMQNPSNEGNCNFINYSPKIPMPIVCSFRTLAPPTVFVVNLAPDYNKPELRAPWARLLLQGDQ